MTHLTMTPFGRQPVTAGLLATQALAATQAPCPAFSKWEILRDLCAARSSFGISDRDLAVLNALLTFHKPTELRDEDALIVFPSNASLAERAHGMAESTLRRHLAALVRAGLLIRHDSPNGKRYATRGRDGQVLRAFGFDLRPLLVRAVEIAEAAEAARAAAEELRQLRETCVLLSRDAAKLIIYGRENVPGANWDALEDHLRLSQRVLRRKPTLDLLRDLREDLQVLLRRVGHLVGVRQKTDKTSGNDVGNERHYQNSKTEDLDFEPCQEEGRAPGKPSREMKDGDEPKLPLPVVLKACPDVIPYARDDIRHWEDFVRLAYFLRGMMGISPDAWERAIDAMGAANAAITLSCILQRVSEINSPGGYLRALTEKATRGAFSPGPMVMALLNTPDKRAA